MVFMDPPAHTRLRARVSKAFTPSVVDALRPRIEETVEQVLSRLSSSKTRTVDLVEEFAYPIPLTVICDLLGVPEDEREQFRQWSADLVATLDPVSSPDLFHRANLAADEFLRYLLPLMNHRRLQPKEDLLSALVASTGSERLAEDELASICTLLLIAGHETTVGLISNGLLALLSHPDQWRSFVNSASVGIGIEELLRYTSPVQVATRTALEDVALRGKSIRKGQQVVALIAAANRDPEHFPDPERLDATRDANHHLAFGIGIHFCLGAALARLEAEVAISKIASQFPEIRLADEEQQWHEGFTIRRLRRLTVKRGMA
jgi:cytochrome P450